MQIMHTYHIEILGKMDVNSFNLTSPLQIRVVKAKQTETLLSVLTDQSGIIGLIRHLHHQGFELLSVFRVE